jgi:hypothetical protein
MPIAEQKAEIAILVPRKFGEPSELQKELQPAFKEWITVESRLSLEEYHQQLASMQARYSKAFGDLLAELHSDMKTFKIEVNEAATYEMEATSRQIEKHLKKLNDDLEGVIKSVSHPPTKRDKTVPTDIFRSDYDITVLFPEIIKLASQGIDVIDIFLKSPIGSALSGALATKLIDAVADYIKKHKSQGKETDIRLFGPDKKLIKRKKFKKWWF